MTAKAPVRIHVAWKGDTGFLGETEDGARVVMGQVGDEKGLSPMELLLASVAGCSGVDVVLILNKMRVPFTDLRITVEGWRRDEHPRVYTRVFLTYHVWGQGLNPQDVKRAVRLSLEKYCSASATVAAYADIEYVIVLHEVDPEGG